MPMDADSQLDDDDDGISNADDLCPMTAHRPLLMMMVAVTSRQHKIRTMMVAMIDLTFA